MTDSLHIHYSNRVEQLYTHYKAALFTSSSPFTKRLVVVPSPAMKSWIMLQMAKDSDLGISMGIEITYLNQAIQKIIPSNNPTLTSLELALIIEKEILHSTHEWPNMNPQEKSIWEPLFHYLKLDSLIFSRKSLRRLSALSSSLTSLFEHYGVFGGSMIPELKQSSGWQEQLWNRIFEKQNWGYPYKNLLETIENPEFKLAQSNTEIHIFALSFIPKLYHNLLLQHSKSIPVNIYVLSPCQAFWGDLVSDRESQRLKSYWQKRGISNTQQIELEEYLRNQNSLLANFGRLGREMAYQLEDSCAYAADSYIVPSTVCEYETYESQLNDEILLANTKHPLTLLEAIQTDLTLLRNPDITGKVALPEWDNTVQIHTAPSRMREIEILYNNILEIINRHSDDDIPIYAGDIFVMAPNINDYVPYIKALFEGRDSLLKAQIMDLSIPTQNPYVQGFLCLLSIPDTRWELATLLQLLNHPDFQHCHSLTLEDTAILIDWMKTAGVRWGIDPIHRNTLLKEIHCRHGMVDETPYGTWEHAVDQLLEGLWAISNDNISIDMLQGELLGKWIELIRSLRNDLQCLEDNTKMTVDQWSHYLRCLCNSYLLPEQTSDQEVLNNIFDSFAKANDKLDNALFSFESIKHHLYASLNQQHQNHRERTLDSIRFCSLLPMRAIPAKVIVMVGMEDGAYPRNIPTASLNLMQSYKNSDYMPSQIDYDRYLFLETLISARRYLLFSYQGQTADNKEQLPSILISELLHYLDQAYTIADNLPSNHCLIKHPFHSFDSVYFSMNSPVKNHISSHFKAAQAHYESEKQENPGFLTKFLRLDNQLSLDVSINVSLDIEDLNAFARNPIKTYFNKTLGIYLENSDKRQLKSDEDFSLTALQNVILTKDNALKQPVDLIINQAHRSNRFPIGAFKPIAVNKLEKEIANLKGNLSALGIPSAENIFSITCSDQFSSPMQTDSGNWQLPPMNFQLKEKILSISGTIPEVTTQGLIVHAEDNKVSSIKSWPQFLLFCCLIKTYNLPIEPHLLMIKGKSGKRKQAYFSNPFQLFVQYLEYYFSSLNDPSPLIPEWIPHLISMNNEDFSEKMEASLTNPFQPLYNDYLEWALHKNKVLPDGPLLADQWKPAAQQLFAEMFLNWYQKGSVEDANATI